MPRITECICGSSVRLVLCLGPLQPQIVSPYSWGQIRMRNAMNPAYTKSVFVNLPVRTEGLKVNISTYCSYKEMSLNLLLLTLTSSLAK